MYKVMMDKAIMDKEIIYVINPTTYIVDNPNIKVTVQVVKSQKGKKCAYKNSSEHSF